MVSNSYLCKVTVWCILSMMLMQKKDIQLNILIIGNRAIYEDGWLARAIVSLPWGGGKKRHSVEKTMDGSSIIQNQIIV